jgi:hypothetical protein
MKRITVLLVFASLIIFSCSKEEPVSDKNDLKPDNENGSVIVKNGLLVFRDMDSFEKTTNMIANFDDNQRAKWEGLLGFESQHSIVNQIISEEQIHDSMCYIWYKDIDIKTISESEKHSNLYNKYLNVGVIKVIDKGTDDEYWDYAICNRKYIDYVNQDGLFAIGDTIYQVTDKYFKSYKKGDFSKIDLLKLATEDNETNNIQVKNMVSTLKTYDGCPGLIDSAWVSSGNSNNSKRIKIDIFLDVQGYNPSATRPAYQFYHEVYVQCQRRNIWGKWKYDWCDASSTVNGSWDIGVFYREQTYGNSWSYTGSFSYLKACINPQTGLGAVYQSYFTVYCDNPWSSGTEAAYPPHFHNYNWTATREGGCCGLTAHLTK